jgi:hypothetical protein
MKMKLLTRTLSLLTIASLTLFFANCGGDDGGGKSKEEKQLDKLKKTWTIQSVELDNVDRTADFTGFTLTITGTYDKDAVAGDYPYDYSVGEADLLQVHGMPVVPGNLVVILKPCLFAMMA